MGMVTKKSQKVRLLAELSGVNEKIWPGPAVMGQNRK